MWNQQQIQSHLLRLNELYLASAGSVDATLYSKLAIIEFCGWIEETMDHIITTCLNKHVFKDSRPKLVKKVIESTYGFEYNQHFKPMLIQVFGIAIVERVESCVGSHVIDDLKSVLGSMKSIRNKVAHTCLVGATPIVNAPSVTINYFNRIYSDLLSFYNELKKVQISYTRVNLR